MKVTLEAERVERERDALGENYNRVVGKLDALGVCHVCLLTYGGAPPEGGQRCAVHRACRAHCACPAGAKGKIARACNYVLDRVNTCPECGERYDAGERRRCLDHGQCRACCGDTFHESDDAEALR